MSEIDNTQGKPAKPKRYVWDEQTGQMFELKDESPQDILAATVSIIYLMIMLAFFIWQLFDVWFGQYSLAILVRYPNVERLNSPTFHLLAYTIIGGGLGGVVNGIRSFLKWHTEYHAFGIRFWWKYFTLPWLGATLALFVYAIIRSGIAVFGSDAGITTTSISQSLSTLSVGALAGYGSRQVFIWLDAQVSKLFKVGEATQNAETAAPDLQNMTRDEAEKSLRGLDLKGKELTEVSSDESAIDKVIKQNPPKESKIKIGETVEYTIAVKK